jgi:hypothetical protein
LSKDDKYRRYAVYFFPDGSRRLYFGYTGYEYGEKDFPLSYLEKTDRIENLENVLKYEKMILKKQYEYMKYAKHESDERQTKSFKKTWNISNTF